MRNFGSALMNVALLASPFSSGAATSAYYASRNASYGRNNSYLVDEGLNSLRGGSWSGKSKSKEIKSEAPSEWSTEDLVLNKSRAVRELIVVDSYVNNKELFSQLIKPGVELIRIDSEGNGFDQLMTKIRDYGQLDAIHLFAHKASGKVRLGTSSIDPLTLENSVQGISRFDNTIKDGGELIIYDCEVSADGEEELTIATGSEERLEKKGVSYIETELEIAEGDKYATPAEGSIARIDLSALVPYDGTLAFGNMPTGYANSKSYTIPTTTYTVKVKSGGSGSKDLYNYSAGYVYVSTNDATHTEASIYFTQGETFDLSSVYVYQGFGAPTKTISITSSKGATQNSASTVAGSSGTTINMSGANWEGITSFTISYSDNTDMHWVKLDNVVIANLQAGPDPLSASIGTPTDVSCNGQSDGALTASASDGTAPYTYSWNNGQTVAAISSLPAGTYTVTVIDAEGNTTTQSASVSEPSALGTSITDQNDPTTNGGSDGSLTAAGSGGTAPYTYSWNNGQTVAAISGLSAGTYTVSVTDANGCGPDVQQATLSDPPISLMISEFIANPFGSESTSEWVEIHNYGSSGIDINGFKLKDEDSDDDVITSTSTTIPAGGYVIVAKNKSNFESIWFGGNAVSNVLEVSGLTMSNTTDELILTDASDNVIWSLAYSDDESEGKATWISTATNTPTTWGSKASPGIVRDGNDVSGSTGYEKNNATADPLAFTNTDGDTGSPLNGTVLFANSAINNNVSCNGLSDGSLTASALGGVSPHTYSWNNGATTATTNSLVAFSYTVTVTDANGLTATSSSTVTEPDALVANASTASNVSCNGGSDGSVMAAPTGGTSPYTYTWNTGDTQATDTGLPAGTYTITVTDANGCTATGTASTTEPTALSAGTVTDSNVSVNGLTDGQATASASGGTAPYTYSWNNGQTTATATGLPAGTYTVSVTDNNGCGPATDQVTITEPAVLTALSMVDFNVNCNGGSDGGASASASGGTQPYTYAWSNGATSESITNSVAGTYTVTVTDANGGTSTSSSTITEPTALSASGVVDMNVSINGGSDGGATAAGSGGTPPYTYSWNNGQTTATITGQPAGTYTVSVTDNNGCGPATDQVTITQPAVLTAASVVDANVNCNGGSDGGATASATGGTQPYTYVWSNGATNASITNSVAGTYTVTVTDANGGTSTSSSTITEPTALSAAGVVDMNVSINGGNDGGATAAGSGGTPPYTYSWNNGQTTATITGQPAGTYTVSVTDNNGCGPATDEVTITEPAVLTALSMVDFNVNCNGGSDGGASASASGGTPPYTYAWSNGATTESITNSVAGTYTVTVTDANGATSTSSSTITEPTALSATGVVDMNVSINGSNDGQATAAGSGGTPPYTYAWNTGATTATATGLPAGTFTVSVTDNNGCGPATDQVTITEPAVLTALSMVDFNVNCNGGSDGGASASASGGTQPYTYVWSNGSTSESITNSVAGTYTVTVTDANGATSTSSSTITEPTALSAAGVVDMNVSINGGSDGGATAAGSGGTPPYTYSWNNGQTTATITGQPAGTYTVSVTDNNGCGPATDQVTITQPAVLTAASVVDANVNCNGGSDGGATASATGGTQPYTYVWSNGATNASITNSVAGTYTVTVTDANGGTSTSSSTITEPTALSAAGVVDMNVSINGGSDGGATAAGSGGTPPYTYSWNNGQTTATITGQPAGTYTVSVTDNNGCGPATDQVTITEPAVLTALSMVDFNVNCNGGSDGGASASASGGTQPYTYTWSNGATTESITNSVAGTYTVTVTDANGATSTSSSTITEPTALSATGVVDMNVSINGSNDGQATAAGSGGTPPYTYAWNTGATTATATGLPAGTFTVSVTDNNGCGPATDQVTITEPAVLTALSMVDFNVNCNGGSDGGASASASGGTQPYTYVWSNGSTSESITNSVAGTYTVTVTDANGATSTSSSTITEPTALSAAGVVDMNVSINGGSDGGATAAGSGGTPPYTYSWNNGQTTATITGQPAGTYTVSVTDNNGCGPATDQVTITEPVVLSALSVVDFNIDCNGGTGGGASAAGSGGVPPYTFAWSTGATTPSIGKTINDNSLVAGTYTVTVTDANGATATSSSTVTEPTVLSAAGVVDMNVSINGGSDGGATAAGSGGTPPYTYLWSTGATNASVTNLPAGTYTVTVTDNNGCGPATDQVTITEPAALIAASVVDANVNCNGDSDGGATASATGGTQPYTYVWSNGTTNASITNSAAGTYTVTVTDANGATSTSSSTITEPTELTANVGGANFGIDFDGDDVDDEFYDETASCNGFLDGGLAANAAGGTGPYTYLWSIGATTGSIVGVGAGTYTVTVTDANGCTATSQGTITEPDALSPTIGFVSSISCNGSSDGEMSAGATGGTSPYTYAWSNGATTASTGQIAAGTYTVTITDANGCTATDSETISEPVAIQAAAIPERFVSINGLSDGEAIASATGGTTPFTYLWSNGGTTSTITNLAAGTYTVSVTDANGCGPSTAEVEITQPAVLEVQTVVDFNVDCNGDGGGGASASASGGVMPYTYLWSTGSTTSSIGKLASNDFLTAGTYTVTVTDNNGATATSSSTVTEPSTLSASVAGSTIDDGFGTIFDETISCNGFTDGGLTASPTGGTGPYTYTWNIGATTSSIVGIGAGTYTVTVTDNNGCTTTAEGTVTEPDILAANANTDMDVSRFNDADGEISSTPTGGTGPYSYIWSNGGTTASQTSLSAGTYTVTVTDANGCTASQSTTVTQPPNSDPEFDSGPVTMVGDDELYFYLIETSDDDDHDVNVAGTTLPSWLSLENGVFAAVNFAGSPQEPGTADGTGADARFAAPYGIEIDDNENIYVADAIGLIKKITPEGVVTTFAGNGTQATVDGTGTGASFDGPAGLAFDDQGNLYVSEIGGNVIRKITPAAVVSTFAGSGSAGMLDGTGSSATFNQPYGMTSDDNGNLYVTDFNNHLIRKIDPQGVVTTLAGSGFGAGTGSGSGSDSGFGSGTFADGTGTEASFNGPLGIDIDHNGNLYVADAFNAMIRKITPEGVVSQFIGKGIDFGSGEPGPDSGVGPVAMGTGTDAVFAGIPVGLTIDEQDNLYITQGFFGAPAVLQATPEGVLQTILGGGESGTADGTGTDAQFASAFDITIDDFGNIYLAETEAVRIRKVVFGSVLIGDPTDQVGDHPVLLDASDGNGGTAQQAFTITVKDQTAPEFESGTAANFAENGTGTVYTAMATDTNSKAVITYSLGQGMDSQFFTIDPTTGILTFLNPPDFENPQDSENDNTYKVEIHASDDAQNSSDAFTVTVTVTDVQEDITPPDKPVITGISDDTGASDSDGITSDKNITISGTAEANASVEVFTQFGPIRKTQADGNGDWILDITDITLVEIMVNLTAQAVDAAGNSSEISDIFVLTPDFTAPEKPIITGITDDTGASDSDGVTNDKNISVSGTAEPNTIIEVSTQFGPLRNTQADANGDWVLDITDVTLIELTVDLTAEAVDLAGNRSPSSDAFKLTPDFTAPAKPVITGISDDTGVSDSDGITNDKNIIIMGTAEPNASVEVFTQFGSIRKTQADTNGDWILDITDITLVEIMVNLTAEAEDLAGNVSAKSDVFTLTPDFTAPAKPVITGITDDTGASDSDGITSDKNISIMGTAEPNASVEVFTQFGPIRKTQADGNGDWVLDITDITLVEIMVDLTAEAEDVAGNVSAKSDVFKLTPDFTAPAKPVITGITDDTGSSSSDGITKDKNITISGTAEPGAIVEVSTQFGPVRKTQANAGGNWVLDITDITLFEIVVNLTAEAVDAAGNVSPASDVFVLTPDFTAPGVTIDIANISAAGYTIIALFDEVVSGLTLGEISVTGGSASNLVQDDPMSYSFIVSLSGSTASVQVTAGSAQDVAGNDNTVSNLLSLNSPNNGAGEDFNNLPSLAKAEEISLYPNPASEVLTIDLSELSAEEVDIFLYDAAGSPVFTRQVYDQKTLKLDVSTYTSGMYIVQVYDGQQVIRKKVMVKK